MIFNPLDPRKRLLGGFLETFPSRKDQRKNMRKKKKNTGVMAQIQYESAEHSPNYSINASPKVEVYLHYFSWITAYD